MAAAAIIDTGWQTETGGVMISPCRRPPHQPGSATCPCPGHRRRHVGRQRRPQRRRG